MIEPTLQNLQWICQNAEKAWQENDPKAFEYWEQQKKLFFRACYERIESLTKQLQLLNLQQQELLNEVQHNRCDPVQANTQNRIITEHKELLTKQLHYYTELIKTLDNIYLTHRSPITQPIPTVPVNQEPSPRRSIFYYIFLTNIGQIIICIIVLLTSVSLIWSWKTKDKKVTFTISTPSERYIEIKITNNSYFPARLNLTSLSNYSLFHYTYLLQCTATLNQNTATIILPIQCIQYGDMSEHFPVKEAQIEIPISAEKSILINTHCLSEQYQEITQLTLTIKPYFFRTPIYTGTFPIKQ